MKVKVGDKIYDSNRVPIMVILEPRDKELIANMAPDAARYCSYPDHFEPIDILNWMKEAPYNAND